MFRIPVFVYFLFSDIKINIVMHGPHGKSGNSGK